MRSCVCVCLPGDKRCVGPRAIRTTMKHKLTGVTGKSLEQIDEIFGDIQNKRDVEFNPEKEAVEKDGVSITEGPR